MSSPINPLTNPLAQINSFDLVGSMPITGGMPGNVFTQQPSAQTTSQTGQQLGQMLNPFSSGPSAGSVVSQTVSTTVLSYLFTSRFVLFILGIICVIAGLYLLKPGPVTTILQAPIKAAKTAAKTATEAALAS